MWWKKWRKQIDAGPCLTYNWNKEQVAILLEVPTNTTIRTNGKPLKTMQVIRHLDFEERLFLFEHQKELQKQVSESMIKPVT